MSLLMDALKKAEQDKKDAAKRLKEAETEKGDELELSHAEAVAEPESADESGDPSQEKNLELADDAIGTSKAGSADLSLEPMGDELQTGGDDNKEQQANDVELKPEGDSGEQGSRDEITIEHPSMSGKDEVKVKVPDTSDQTSTLPTLSIEEPETAVEDTIQSSGPDEYTETISDSRITRSVISAAELASDIGDVTDHPTPVAAQTIFTAVGTSRTGDTFKWVMFIILCLIITVSFSVFYYFSITPLDRDLSSPLVAKGVESDPVLLPMVEIPEEILTGEIIDEPDIQAATTDEIYLQEDVSAAMTGQAVDEPEATAPELSAQMTDTPVVEPDEPEVKEDIVTVVPPVLAEGDADTGIATTLPDKIEIESALIEISHSKTKDTGSVLINKAYAEYIAGDYVAAEASYREVLKKNTDNRDALLGLAAIAYQKADYQSAFAGYLKILKLYPNDTVAKAALINMQRSNDKVKNESIVKSMLIKEPEAPFLHFTLGNLYAAQLRWPDAQEAYFNAYRLESDNPDYAFNLAVSLDHIGQINTALDYYNVALRLADNAPVNFNTATVLARINALSAVTQSN